MSHPLKILTITDLFDPSVGGMELHVLEVARERRRMGIDVTVATLTPSHSQSLDREDGLRVERISETLSWARYAWRNPERPFHPPFPILGVARALRRLVDQLSPDAVHAHNWIVYSYLAIKRPSDPPVFWMQHDYSLACAKKSGWFYRDGLTCEGPAPTKCVRCAASHYGTLKGAAVATGLRGSNKLLLRRVDSVAANSVAVREFIRTTMPPGVPIPIVPGFVEEDLESRAQGASRPSYLPVNDGYLLYVGSTGRYKGIYDLLDAYERLDGAPPLVVLQVPRHDSPTVWPPGVIVRDSVPYDEVLVSMRHCGFVVVPSRWPEPFGRVVLEAASFGKPTLATRVGGLAELVGEDGVLVPPGDSAALTRAMVELISDPEGTRRMGMSASRKVENYTVRKTTLRLNALIKEMIARHSRNGDSTQLLRSSGEDT